MYGEVAVARTLEDVGRDIATIVDPQAVKRMLNAGGRAGKEAALKAAEADLGGDRAFSGMRRKVPLGAGFDDAGGTQVEINFRPAGLWRLAQAGRRSSGTIRPRRRGGRRALLTPAGPRASSSYGPSRGLGTFDTAVDRAQREVPKAAVQQFQTEVARAMRG